MSTDVAPLADERCVCHGDDLDSRCPVHGNHPSNIEPEIEDGDYHRYIWSSDDDQ